MIQGALPPGFAIPIVEWPSDAGGYGNVAIDAADPRHGEPLVRVSEYGVATESFYARSDGGNAPYKQRIEGSFFDIWVRAGVAERLALANAALLPFGFEVLVLDGYRSISTQRGLWSYFEAEARRRLVGADADAIRAWVLRYVSDPTRFRREDPRTWPVHCSGGAVDVTLRECRSHAKLDMGSAFDEMSSDARTDALEREAAAGRLAQDAPALGNRRLLFWCMDRAGFVNYPLEYWHFDWGDQMYIHNLEIQRRQAPRAAWYGYIDPPLE